MFGSRDQQPISTPNHFLTTLVRISQYSQSQRQKRLNLRCFLHEDYSMSLKDITSTYTYPVCMGKCPQLSGSSLIRLALLAPHLSRSTARLRDFSFGYRVCSCTTVCLVTKSLEVGRFALDTCGTGFITTWRMPTTSKYDSYFERLLASVLVENLMRYTRKIAPVNGAD